MSAACEKYLNMKFKRPSPFFAFTEAKVSMALFKQREIMLKNKDNEATCETTATSSLVDKENSQAHLELPLDEIDPDDQVTLTGAELKKLIREYTRKCIREEISEVMKKLNDE